MTMVESRHAERVRSFLRARIVFNNQNSTIDCIVKNISPTGAKIEISNALSVPAEFDLDIPQKGRSYRARIQWRDTDSMGVEFVADHQTHGSHESGSSVDKLERENRKLRSVVFALTKRLEDLGQAVDHVI